MLHSCAASHGKRTIFTLLQSTWGLGAGASGVQGAQRAEHAGVAQAARPGRVPRWAQAGSKGWCELQDVKFPHQRDWRF